MDQRHTVLVISENAADHLILAESLERALPARFTLANNESLERPLEALLDPSVDAVIVSHGPETDYLLRLAQKNGSCTPIIVLLEEPDMRLAAELTEAGAQDYLVRGQLQDHLIHRILDYSIQLKQARLQIQQLSSRDGLTGTLNRAGFRSHVARAMERSERYGFRTALLYLNIDQFNFINEQFGETSGDSLIQEMADRLSNKLRNSDCIARIGGDEFAVVLEDVSDDDNVEAIASKMLDAISEPLALENQKISVNASIGAAVYPDDGRAFGELVNGARSAMQQAKAAQGGKFVRYSEQISFNEDGNTAIAAELRNALRRNEFGLHFQPRIDLSTGQLVGVEALLRWLHPTRGIILPGEFLAECETMGLMKTIGYQVIQQACNALKWLDEQGMEHVVVAVNISFSQFQDERFVDIVTDIVKRARIDPNRLEFELTESTILKNAHDLKPRLEALRMMGISFSLDDFGTGFSQLSHITELPISALKIDAGFVRDVPTNAQQVAVCKMIIDMAERLDMLVVAEGAESREQVRFLMSQGCHQVQGFYYSPAIPLERLPRFVQEQRFRRRDFSRHLLGDGA